MKLTQRKAGKKRILISGGIDIVFTLTCTSELIKTNNVTNKETNNIK